MNELTKLENELKEKKKRWARDIVNTRIDIKKEIRRHLIDCADAELSGIQKGAKAQKIDDLTNTICRLENEHGYDKNNETCSLCAFIRELKQSLSSEEKT